MRLIIPMAGIGKRMRPHSLTVPKPLLPIAGKPIIERLIEETLKIISPVSYTGPEFNKSCDPTETGISNGLTNKIEEIAFVIGNFGNSACPSATDIEKKLIALAEKNGAKGVIYHQPEPLGTAHAILCAEPSLKDDVIIIFADTLFKADFIIDTKEDAIIFVKKVDNPSSFGVVKVNEDNIITDFIEKPNPALCDTNLVIIGLYYFKNAQYLKEELQHLINNNTVVNGEYQLTDVLQNMKNRGIKIKASVVSEWFDCGNKDAMVYANQKILQKEQNFIPKTVKKSNSVIIKPCYIGENVKITNSIIGPYVSVGEGTIINNSIIKNSIIQTNSFLENINIENSMLGNYVEYRENIRNINLGDYSALSSVNNF